MEKPLQNPIAQLLCVVAKAIIALHNSPEHRALADELLNGVKSFYEFFNFTCRWGVLELSDGSRRVFPVLLGMDPRAHNADIGEWPGVVWMGGAQLNYLGDSQINLTQAEFPINKLILYNEVTCGIFDSQREAESAARFS